MQMNRNVATLSLALLIGACGKPQSKTADLPDDLKKDLAAASVSGGDLAIAPRAQRSVRFVSDIEQWKGSAQGRAKLVHRSPRATTSHHPAPQAMADMGEQPAVSMVAATSAAASTEMAPAREPSTLSAPSPSPEPAASGSGSDSNVGDRGHGGGLGGLLGGIIGAVVIRGGYGGVDKCDTRDHRRPATSDRPTIIERPDFGLPVPVPSGRVFGRH